MDAGGGCADTVLGAAVDDDAGALGGEGFRDSEADAGSGAGDEGEFAGELEVHGVEGGERWIRVGGWDYNLNLGRLWELRGFGGRKCKLKFMCKGDSSVGKITFESARRPGWGGRHRHPAVR